jgi:hypothetical protein
MEDQAMWNWMKENAIGLLTIVAAIATAMAIYLGSELGAAKYNARIAAEAIGQPEINPCDQYNLRIASYQESSDPDERTVIRGAFVNSPPVERVYLIAADDKEYWPQDQARLSFRQSDRTWRGEASVPHDGVVIIAIVGNSGRILFNYFFKVGIITERYFGIDELPDDVLECDRITVPGQSTP